MHFIFSQDIKDHKMSRISESRIGFQAETKVQQREKQRYHHVIITVTTHGLKFQFLPSDDIGKKIPSRDKSDAALLFAN